jgi:hypothetical protein
VVMMLVALRFLISCLCVSSFPPCLIASARRVELSCQSSAKDRDLTSAFERNARSAIGSLARASPPSIQNPGYLRGDTAD